MKHLYQKLITASILALMSTHALAYNYEVDGIYYHIDSKTTSKLDSDGTYRAYVEYFISVTHGDKEYSGDISIPSTITYNGESCNVTSISDYAFYDCKNLTSIAIPNSVTYIGKEAFVNCTGLTSITIPNSVTSINSSTFYNCSGLTYITMPNSVLYIEESAFRNCTGLTSITIPSSVKSIGDNAFSGCSALTSIIVDKENPIYNDGDGNNCIIESASNTLIAGTSSTIIPSSVTSIGTGAFYQCTGLTSVIIPNNVTTIENYAFGHCVGLTSVTIPQSVTKLGVGAFANCTGLSSVTIPKSVVTIGNDYEVFGISRNPFENCSNLTSIKVDPENSVYDDGGGSNCIVETQSNSLLSGCKSTIIPNRVTTIKTSAFEGCSKLTSIIIPNSVTSIEFNAFRNCSGISSITIPNSVTNIGGEAFMGCSCMVISSNETPPTASINTFNSNMTAMVPPSAIDAYRNAEGWNVMNIIASGVSIDVTATTSPSHLIVTGGYGNTDATITEFGFEGYEPFEDVIEMYGLDPETEYTFTYYVVTEEGGKQTQDFTFKTDKLSMIMMDPKTVKLGEVVVAAQTNLDDKETNVGFEWRREDWGDKFRPKTGGGIIYQGTIEGSIRDLNTNYLWLVKPYYLSNTGNYHYGEEIGIDPSDVSYFDPVVHTADNAEVSGNSATVQGYVINGSDQVTSQGMEYWKEVDGQSQSTTVETAGGQVMSTNLTNLDYETTYDYVAFATTTSGQTYYGEVKKFKTGKKTSDNKGDVNSDGNVDISDIVAIINQIAGTATYKNADVNNDKKVDISDIVAVINIIASK